MYFSDNFGREQFVIKNKKMYLTEIKKSETKANQAHI